MAEYDLIEDGLSYEITPTDVMTGDRNRRMQLYYQLIQSISGAKQIDIIVSFLMESGVRMLLKDLKSALDRGVTVRILTGNYLGITQPSALYLIKHKLGERVDLRFYNESERSFHPKAYIFHYEDTIASAAREIRIIMRSFSGRLRFFSKIIRSASMMLR